MKLDQRQQARLVQRQELRLTQQLIQKLELLQLPALDLQQLVQQELQENPLLEIREERPDERTPETESDGAEPAPEEDRLAALDEWQAEWQTGERRRAGGRDESQDEKYLDMMQNIEADGITLQDHLIRQVNLMDLPDETKRIVEVIIGLLDEDGYLRRIVKDGHGKPLRHEPIPDEEIANLLSEEPPFQGWTAGERVEAVRRAIENVVHKLDPAGVGARTLREALLLQLPEETPFHDVKKLLIEKYLDDIAHNRLPKLARELLKEPIFTDTFEYNVYTDRAEIIDTLKMLIQDIHKLNPVPAREFRPRRSTHIVPEIIIREVENGEFEAILNDSYIPEVYVNETYRRILQDPKAPREQKEFIRKKMGAARALVEAILQRRVLIQKVADRVVEHQKEFFRGKIDALRPLKMKTLANEFGVHISTISRAVNGKYVHCPQGIFPLKFFFASAAVRSNQGPSIFAPGERRSKVSILEKLSEIVANEDKSRPYSDEELAKKLREAGIKVSRRAVTKYRKELRIPSSKVRRQY